MNAAAQARPAADTGARSELPLVLLTEDVAAVLGLQTASAARRCILRGEVGPYIRRGRRLLLRREAFLEALRQREVHPGESRPRGALRPKWAPRMIEETRPRRGR